MFFSRVFVIEEKENYPIKPRTKLTPFQLVILFLLDRTLHYVVSEANFNPILVM